MIQKDYLAKIGRETETVEQLKLFIKSEIDRQALIAVYKGEDTKCYKDAHDLLCKSLNALIIKYQEK